MTMTKRKTLSIFNHKGVGKHRGLAHNLDDGAHYSKTAMTIETFDLIHRTRLAASCGCWVPHFATETLHKYYTQSADSLLASVGFYFHNSTPTFDQGVICQTKRRSNFDARVSIGA